MLILIFVVNLTSLVYLTVNKIMFCFRVRKAKKFQRIAIKKAARKKQQQQLEMEQKQKLEENSADDAKEMSEILL